MLRRILSCIALLTLAPAAPAQPYDAHEAIRLLDDHVTQVEQRAEVAERRSADLQTRLALLQTQVPQPDRRVIAGIAVHVRDPQTEPPQGVTWSDWLAQPRQWDFGEEDPQARMEGFNAAYVYEKPGTYVIRFNGKPVEVVLVLPPAEPVVFPPDRPFADLQPLLRDGAVIHLQRGARYAIPYGTKVWIRSSAVIIGSTSEDHLPPPVLELERPPEGQKTPNRAFTVDKSCKGLTIQDLAFTTPGTREVSSKIGTEGVWAAGTDVTVRRNIFLDMSVGVQGEGSPTNLLVSDNVVPDKDLLRSYLVWVARGNGVVLLRNRVPDSVNEHPLRMRWTNYILADSNTLANPGKGCVEMQAGSYHYAVRNSITDGVIRTGNLDSSPPEDDASVSRWVVIRDNRMTGNSRIYVSRSARDVLVTGNQIDTTGNGIAVETGHGSRWSERIYVHGNSGKKLDNPKREKRPFVMVTGERRDEAVVEDSDWR